MTPNRRRRAWIGPLLAATLALPGCVSGVPARRLPREFLAQPRANKDTIDYVRLRQDPPKEYRVGPRDILGVYIEGVLGQAEAAPPVQAPERGSNLPPVIGFPV